MWEDSTFFLNKKSIAKINKKQKDLILLKERKLIENKYLSKNNLKINFGILLIIFKSIEGRENIKFKFSQNLNNALDQIVIFGNKNKIPRKDLSFLN